MGKFSYVCVLQSERDPSHFYTGSTDDLRERLICHKSSKVPYTAKRKPWRIKTYIAFSDSKRGVEFRAVLKVRIRSRFSKKAPLSYSTKCARHCARDFSCSLRSSVGRTNRPIVLYKIGGQKTDRPTDKSECEAPVARRWAREFIRARRTLLIGPVMIGAQAGPQWSFVGSLRDEGRLYRGLSRASTTRQ